MATGAHPDLDLDAWRARVLSHVLRVVAVLSGFAAAAGVSIALSVGVYVIAVFDTLAWLVLLGLWRLAMPYRVRALVLVGLLYVVGVVIIGVLGPNGAGHLWLIGAPVVAALLSGRRAFFGWLALDVIALAVFSAISSKIAPWPDSRVDTLWWVMVMSSVTTVVLLVGLPTLDLLDGLEGSLAARAQARDLAEQRERREAALRAQFESLFAQSPAALLLVAPGGAVVRPNLQAQQLFALAPVPSSSLTDLLGAEAQAAAARLCAAWESEPNAAVAPFEATLEGTNTLGEPRVVAVRIAPLRVGDRTHALVSALDVGARVAAERAVQEALGEKVTLLQEVHHRVKNNLQIVSSLLGLQADRVSTDEARDALIESTHRIRTMALVHQQLYASDNFTRIDFGSYARTLVGEVCAALAPDAQLSLQLAPVEVALAEALPCGLILNELLTNTLKHGRSPDGVCRLTIEVAADEGRLRVEVRDRGVGLAAPWSHLKRRSLGGRIIDALVRQLRATLEADAHPDGGARFRLRLPSNAEAAPT